MVWGGRRMSNGIFVEIAEIGNKNRTIFMSDFSSNLWRLGISNGLILDGTNLYLDLSGNLRSSFKHL